MRKTTNYKQPKNRFREVKKFLWFPKKLNNQWRWFERASILQEYYQNVGWVDVEWI